MGMGMVHIVLGNQTRDRNDFTVISGLSHPNVRGGHSTENCFLTAARNPTASGFRNTISLDQFAAEQIGHLTRFPTLNLGVNIDKANRSLAWTRDGCLIPPEDRPSRLFEKLFVTGSPAEVAARRRQLVQRESILDCLERLPDVLAKQNPTLGNLELSMHIDKITCSADGLWKARLMMRNSQYHSYVPVNMLSCRPLECPQPDAITLGNNIFRFYSITKSTYLSHIPKNSLTYD